MRISGFKASAVSAGLRAKSRLDLGLIVADGPVAAAGVFTTNTVKAAPVLWSRECLAGGKVRAILANSGRANASTGPQGRKAASESARFLARELGCETREILLASTGVIGEQLNLEAMSRAMPDLVAKLEADGLPDVAQAILTTDTKPKMAEGQGEIEGHAFRVAGIAKGAGMIAPNMATMLCFILTDAAVEPGLLQTILTRAVESTFNRITVDGDTSTNDTLLVLASGLAGFDTLTRDDSPGREEFERVLTAVMSDLAAMIVADAEGATKLVKVVVAGAEDGEQAKAAAMVIANSPLVKTALFGEDPNWGRLMMALGRSPARFDPEKVDILFDRTLLVQNGQRAGIEAEAAAVMKQPEFTIELNLKNGTGRAEVLTCDFSYDYVKINADYRS